MTISARTQLSESLLAQVGPAGSIADILAWLQERNRQVTVDVELVDFDHLANWHFNAGTGDLEHDSGKFFAIRGVEVHTGGYPKLRSSWSQPIIDQPEVGFLGIITQMIDGVLCFLMQAKIEPGNINSVQLSPTLQATRSNYMQVHKGRAPLYLDYFKNAAKHKIWLDQLQSEQGGRFMRKRNRNIIIEVTEEVPPHPDFIWVTLGQLKELMRHDNVVNMDTRTVLSGLGWIGHDCAHLHTMVSSSRAMAMVNSLAAGAASEALNRTLFWLSELKSRYVLSTRFIPLKEVAEWAICANEIVRSDRLFFRVVGAQITITNREVAHWAQPLVQPMQDGLCALLVKTIGGTMYFLVQAKLECGNHDIVELAPTVQCLTGSYRCGKPAFLDYVLNTRPEQVLLDVHQSEEGGRFFREQNRNAIVETGEDFPEDGLPDNFRWVTLGELQEFMRFNNYLNIQLRSLLATINIFTC